ncbi:hypothetical protein [Phenylobacterium sp.]
MPLARILPRATRVGLGRAAMRHLIIALAVLAAALAVVAIAPFNT